MRKFAGMKRVLLAVLAVVFVAVGVWAQRVEDFYACPCRVKARVDSVIASAAADSVPAILERADGQFFDPSSADYCEGIMALYLSAAIPRLVDETEREVAQWKLNEVCLLNAEGTPAADFSFDLLDGRQGLTLREFMPGDERLCLLFYDPDCGHCAEVIAALSALEVRVLAVCVDSTPERWAESAPELPTQWAKAFDRTDILENETYMLRSLPGIYLLDSHGMVELKNPSPERLINYLNQ